MLPTQEEAVDVRTQDVLRIGQIAERAGLAVSALRHYEAEGLLVADRDHSDRRVYSRAVLRRLAFIRAGQTVGLTLAEIRQALSGLPGNMIPNEKHWQEVAGRWEQRIDERIEALLALKAGLTSCIGCGCLSLRTCALANPQDVSGAGGPGARYLPAALRAPQPSLSRNDERGNR